MNSVLWNYLQGQQSCFFIGFCSLILKFPMSDQHMLYRFPLSCADPGLLKSLENSTQIFCFWLLFVLCYYLKLKRQIHLLRSLGSFGNQTKFKAIMTFKLLPLRRHISSQLIPYMREYPFPTPTELDLKVSWLKIANALRRTNERSNNAYFISILETAASNVFVVQFFQHLFLKVDFNTRQPTLGIFNVSYDIRPFLTIGDIQ